MSILDIEKKDKQNATPNAYNFFIYEDIEENLFEFSLRNDEDYLNLFNLILMNSNNTYIHTKQLFRLFTMFGLSETIEHFLRYSFFIINVDNYKKQLHNRYRTLNLQLIIAHTLKKLNNKSLQKILSIKNGTKNVIDNNLDNLRYETIYVLFYIITFGRMSQKQKAKLFFKVIDGSNRTKGLTKSSVALILIMIKYVKFLLIFTDNVFNELLAEDGYANLYKDFMEKSNQSLYIFFKIHILQMRCSEGKERDFAIYICHKYLFQENLSMKSIDEKTFIENMEKSNFDFFNLNSIRSSFLDFWTIYLKKKNDIFMIELYNMLKYYFEMYMIKQPGARSSLEPEIFKLDMVTMLKNFEDLIKNEKIFNLEPLFLILINS